MRARLDKEQGVPVQPLACGLQGTGLPVAPEWDAALSAPARARNRSRVPAGDRYDGPLGAAVWPRRFLLRGQGSPRHPSPPVWRAAGSHNPPPPIIGCARRPAATCCPAACPGEDDVSSGADGRDVLRARPWRPRHRPLGTLRWDLAGSTGTRSLRERRGLRWDRSWLACPVPGGFVARPPGSGPAVAAWMAKRMMDSSMMWRGARSALPSPGLTAWAASGHVTAEGGPAVPQTCAGFSAARLRVACVLAASGFTHLAASGLPHACAAVRSPGCLYARSAALDAGSAP